MHVPARTGSGGVGFFIKESICSAFNIEILDSSFNGILWLKVTNHLSNFSIYACVCYLPPENYFRQADVHAFFDNLLTSIYNYQNEGVIFICGGFNSRCGDLDDFIAGVDKVPQCKAIDFKTNSYVMLIMLFRALRALYIPKEILIQSVMIGVILVSYCQSKHVR